ncbi:MAG: hypothetical protein U9O56_08475 [Campylobacterota bacterium]|nr:hypothetical protein [Campylobacterota bacterium]
MVGNISSSTMAMPQEMTSQASSSSSSLSTSQQETIASVLEEFDSSNLSASDAQSIMESFKEAGIEPSEELASAMEAEGFDAKEVGDLGRGEGGQGMPPPPPSEEEESTISSLLDTILNIDEEDEDGTTSFFDEVMEYTNRILSLNDDSKTEVMDMLEKYSTEETDFTAEETSNILKNSLSQILSDNDNYNRVSVYA